MEELFSKKLFYAHQVLLEIKLLRTNQTLRDFFLIS